MNLAYWRRHFLGRLARQIAATGDDDLKELLREVSAYPGDEKEPAAPAAEASEFLGPVRFRAPGGGRAVHRLITTKTHLPSLMGKLGARNRIELAMWAYETDRVRG